MQIAQLENAEADSAIARAGPAADTVPPIAYTGVDSATATFFSDYRLRRYNHRTEPDGEAAFCLYGIIRGDSALVAFYRAVDVVEVSGAWLRYQPCPEPAPHRFGELRLLGMQHAHMGGVDCDWSLPDMRSFMADTRVVIDVISCSQGLIWRGRGTPLIVRK